MFGEVERDRDEVEGAGLFALENGKVISFIVVIALFESGISLLSSAICSFIFL